MENQSNFSMSYQAMMNIALFCCLFLVAMPSDARLYKWVDEEGQIRYGDQLPQEFNNKKYFQLDAEGRVIKTKEAGKSPELLKKERALKQKKEKQEAQAKQQAEDKMLMQQRQDRILLLTFNSEDDIFYARDQRLIVLDSKISLLRKNKASSQKKLLDLDSEATTNYRSKQLVVPGGLQQKIEQMSKNILAIDRNISSSENKRSQVEAGFKKDLVRFRDLKARQRQNKK